MPEINSFEELEKVQNGGGVEVSTGFTVPKGVNILSKDMLRRIALTIKQSQSKKSQKEINAAFGSDTL